MWGRGGGVLANLLLMFLLLCDRVWGCKHGARVEGGVLANLLLVFLLLCNRVWGCKHGARVEGGVLANLLLMFLLLCDRVSLLPPLVERESGGEGRGGGVGC